MDDSPRDSEKESKMEAKMIKKSIKKPLKKKTVVFRSGLGHDFLGFFIHFHLKMVLKWNQVKTKIDTKTTSHQKNGFSF